MRKVIDSNYLQSPKLRDYFRKSNTNLAVITYYVAMEAYKGDTLKSIYPSMEIVSEFPRQVLILKPTFPIYHPNSWKSYHFPTAKGTVPAFPR